MTTSVRGESAKVYQFPLGGRSFIGSPRLDRKTTPAPRPPQAPEPSFGSGWYHEAAVRDAERGLKP